MTVDREQIRRDADFIIATADEFVNGEQQKILARHCLALLAELEQAEKHRDIALEQTEGHYQIAQKRRRHLAALAEPARTIISLALTPDVENLVLMPSDPTPLELLSQYDAATAHLREALAAYEADE